ncbi:MAG: hypothetical protein KIS78_20440 [Labilithrix sp.]|nr:hypothetical protein [Labilithrix sp.]
MQELIWYLRVHSSFELVSPYVLPVLIAFGLYQIHYVVVLAQCLVRYVRHGVNAPPPRPGERPAAVLVMPTLLRTADELDGLKKAITSAATNGYPGDLTIVAAIDDGRSKPALFADLEAWAASFAAPPRVRVLATCTEQRTGKAVAIDNGVAFLRRKIAEGYLPEFPPIFFNMDADSALGEHALVRLVDRLTTRYAGSSQYPNIVTSNVSIARSEYWRGWRAFFTVRGQLSVHVAAEFVVAMLGKHNLKLHLVPGASGALYCTWSKLHLQAPRWAAFMQTLTLRDALRWWAGAAPPSFARSSAGELPEAMTGPGDDTWVTWLAYCARWEGEDLTLELPRTPAHAFYYLVRGWFLRALQYEPAAVVETKTPTTIKALFKQRVRWNTSRVELSQRWSPALPFHWTLLFPTVVSTILIVYFNSMEAVSLLLLPLSVSKGFFVHFCCAFVVYSGLRVAATAFGVALDGGFKKHGHKLLGLVLSVPYHFLFNKVTTFWGYVQDVFLFGVNTGFSPEQTHIKSRLGRVAVAYRLRRAFALAVRAVVHNDVPLGWFWLGWHETKWTPSGFEGWTTGKRRVLKPREVAPAAAVAPAAVAPAPVVVAAVAFAGATGPTKARLSLVPGARVSLAPGARVSLMPGARVSASPERRVVGVASVKRIDPARAPRHSKPPPASPPPLRSAA